MVELSLEGVGNKGTSGLYLRQTRSSPNEPSTRGESDDHTSFSLQPGLLIDVSDKEDTLASRNWHF